MRFKYIKSGEHVSLDGSFKIVKENNEWKVIQGGYVWTKRFRYLNDAKIKILEKGYGLYV